ncbi:MULTISPECIES: hypothetical protein [Brucella]|nr:MULTISPECIES: hypothetical protein [Brucella]
MTNATAAMTKSADAMTRSDALTEIFHAGTAKTSWTTGFVWCC